MPWRTVRRFISAYISTAPSGRRIVIDGTGPRWDEIQFFTGNPIETAPGTIGPVDDSGSVGLYIVAPAAAGTEPTYISVVSGGIWGGTAQISTPGQLTLTSDGRAVFGSGSGDSVVSAGGDVILSPTSRRVLLPDGVHVKRGDLTAPALLNSWTPRPGAYNPPRYVELPGNLCMLSGSVAPGTLTGGTVIFNIPAALAPAAAECFEVPCSAAGKAMIQIEPDGHVTIWNATAGTAAISWVALGGCVWPIKGF